MVIWIWDEVTVIHSVIHQYDHHQHTLKAGVIWTTYFSRIRILTCKRYFIVLFGHGHGHGCGHGQY